MSDAAFNFETQRQRWVKYGANVGLTVIVAVALVILLVFLAQKKDHRIDTTAEGNYSLKPQTKEIIGNLKTPITIVSLYSRQSNRDHPDVYAQAVEDLLNEYKADGSKVSVEFIDPISQPSKEDQLIAEVTTKYGGEVKAYSSFLDDYKKAYEQLKAELTKESKAAEVISLDKVDDQEMTSTLSIIKNTLSAFPNYLTDQQDSINRQLKQKPPDYKGAVDVAQSTVEDVARRLAAIGQAIDAAKGSPAAPAEAKQYFADATPRLVAMQKQANDIDDKAKKLGELKLDTLRTSLKQRDAILVMGDNDLRVLPFEQVWKKDEMLRQYASSGKIKPIFAGEQMITTAIYGLTQTKRAKVVFVRPGGRPLCDPGVLGMGGGPLSQVADRLREYNFDVQEKDLSGQYAMQAQMQGEMAGPEPTDAEMKDAIWVVIAVPMNNQNQMQQMPANIGEKLAEHLKAGGSAFVLPFPRDTEVTATLAEWGIDLRTDAITVHEVPPPAKSSSNNVLEELQRYPQVFDIRDYGDTPITKPLRSLDSLLYPLMPVTVHPTKGYAAQAMIPIPDAPKSPKSWGETDMGFMQGTDRPTFDAKSDISGPIFGGAMSEKDGGGRVVVIAAPGFMFDQTLNMAVDPELGISSIPGNMELMCNSMFWLSHQESMISISPSAMQVSRIADMSDATLNAWRVGLLLIGLPGAVIVAGFLVFLSRRD